MFGLSYKHMTLNRNPHPTHIFTNNKMNINTKLIKSFETHLNKNISKRVKDSHSLFEHHNRTCPNK